MANRLRGSAAYLGSGIDLVVSKGHKYYRLEIPFEPSEGHEEQPIWLENEIGEGMSMSEENLFDIIDAAFREQF